MSRSLARAKLADARAAVICAKRNIEAAAEEMAKDAHPGMRLDAATLAMVAVEFGECESNLAAIEECLLPRQPVCEGCE